MIELFVKVSPFYTYFVAFLPKLLAFSLPLSAAAFVIDHRIRPLLWPSIVFVMLMSALGHKEWRFVIYVVPVFNMAAAKAASAL